MDDLKDIEYGVEIDELEKYLKNRTIAMIGLLDGIGYSPDGYNYLHKIMRSISLEAKRLSVFNAHLQTFNQEQYIEDFIASNISLQEVKKLQYCENNMKIEKILEDANLPKDKKLINTIRELLKINEDRIIKTDSSTRLRTIIQEHDEVNIFYSANMDLIDNMTPYYVTDKQMEQRRRNYDYIISLNPKAQIYAIGLMTPNNKKYRTNDIAELNDYYQKISSEFGMIYIDTTGLERCLKKDASGYYLNQEGIAILAFRCIQAMYKRKIKNKTNPNFKIALASVNNREQGIEDLITFSKKREIEHQSELKNGKRTPIWKKNYLMDSVEEEQTKQKIYKKAKEGYFE